MIPYIYARLHTICIPMSAYMSAVSFLGATTATTTSLFLNTNSNPAATTAAGPGGAEAAQLCLNVVKTALELMRVRSRFLRAR